MKILHIITGLKQGGAESALFRLVTHAKDGTEHSVISLIGMGTFGSRLQDAGINTHALNMTEAKLSLKGLINLWRLIRELDPDVVQTWMYHADLIGGLVARLAGYKHVFWGVVHFNLDSAVTKKSTRLIAKLCAILSFIIPTKIISCSVAAVKAHTAIGYASDKFVSIPLGYNLVEFYQDGKLRSHQRLEWELADDATIIGFVGRWDPQKDHANLIKAFSIVRRDHPELVCVLIGPGIDSSNVELGGLIERHLGSGAKVYTLGLVDSISAAMNAIDIHVLPSLGEAFPNVVPEAMACGTPCVVTDVGDAAHIVGDVGWIVPSGDHHLLAEGIKSALLQNKAANQWASLQAACRARIEDNFGMQLMYDSYKKVWLSVLV